MENKTLPVPGSLDAIEKGCICEVEIDRNSGEESYLIKNHCPVHGTMHKHIKVVSAIDKLDMIEKHMFTLVCLFSVLVVLIIFLVFKN